eukprot:TRINITY_DN141_c0_g1_i10.p1 TRINITY_DN141_c0_g1~~TRINITY_DN141_c0_g1_i10.p1  ORF type:complete len:181 (+),score=16.61 TRINITY_DN141_c0_g1_i10:75-617(+)
MKHFFAAMMVSFAADAFVMSDSERAQLRACIRAKFEPTLAPCGLSGTPVDEDPGKPACTPECKAAWNEASHTMDGSCCSYIRHPGMRSYCEDDLKGLGSHLVIWYQVFCSQNLGDFNTALLELLPFGLVSDDENVAAVRAAPVKIGLIAVGGASAGAFGACVALATAYWSKRKQEILLAN